MTTVQLSDSEHALRQRKLELLPEEMRRAQEAVDSVEVQELIKQLAAYNLGVCMPHMHQDGEFVAIPDGTVQVEVKSDFISSASSEARSTLPVSWRWGDDGLTVVGSCHVLRRKCD